MAELKKYLDEQNKRRQKESKQQPQFNSIANQLKSIMGSYKVPKIK